MEFKFKTIKENTTAQIIEKKSKFIANIFYIETMEEADRIIKETKKKYYDARHNCFAYILETGIAEGLLVKYNDDRRTKWNSRSTYVKYNCKRRII